MKRKAIAIDGPSASGKSTIARILSKRLQMPYLDTGAMYRAVTLYCLEAGLDPANEEAVQAVLEKIHLSFAGDRLLLNGVDRTDALRSDVVTDQVSQISAYPAVREKLVDQQRQIAAGPEGAILDGRDIGTVVLPDARLKIFLTASLDVRTGRRFHDEKAHSARSYEALKESIRKRDEDNETRKLAPLKQASDAILVDSSEKSIDEVAQEIEQLWKEASCTE